MKDTLLIPETLDKHLNDLLTDILAIPLAPELPTPNARKTHSTAIWVLQAQRLPEHILQPASSRIAYALQRGLDGELGKEGKKGSISDGLKVSLKSCILVQDDHLIILYRPFTIFPCTNRLPSFPPLARFCRPFWAICLLPRCLFVYKHAKLLVAMLTSWRSEGHILRSTLKLQAVSPTSSCRILKATPHLLPLPRLRLPKGPLS
jgi:hypothetical protein